MSRLFDSDTMDNFDAKFEAQKIVFGPIMFQAARILRDTGILDLLKKNRRKGMTAEEVSREMKMPLYGVKVLLEAGMAMGVLSLKDERYAITKTGYFLIADEMTRVNMDFVHDVCYEGMFRLDESIEKGKPEGLKVFGAWDTIYQALSQLPEKVQKSWFAFDHYYSDDAFPDALKIVFKDSPKKILDIGGNTGRWALQCVGHSEDVQVTIFDLPGQLEKAYSFIKEKGFSSRVNGHEADILNPENVIPSGYDVIWMSQFLDCFSEEEIVMILTKARQAMGEKSRVFIMETFWDRQEYDAATFCLIGTSLYFTAMANGNSKMYHSKDMIRCVEEAGLVVEEDHDRVGLSHTILKCRLK
jgi:hypothetical protein